MSFHANLEQGLSDSELAFSQEAFSAAAEESARVIVGQRGVTDKLLMALVLNGHVLLEGVPGLAKTTMIKAIAHLTGLDFTRMQFTPDLLPADLVGTQIYNPSQHRYETKKGPIFTNLLLADEINRAPAKVQSALLECMAERQVSIGGETFSLDDPFLVLATQNPIEQEGTYRLPEAQLDRFLFYLKVGYGSPEDEFQIVSRAMDNQGAQAIDNRVVFGKNEIHKLRAMVYRVKVSDKIRQYIVNLVFASREASQRLKQEADLARYITLGASPRASIALEQAARLTAILQGRPYVTPQDVKDVALDVMRHRVLLSFEAEVDGVQADQVVKKILAAVDVP